MTNVVMKPSSCRWLVCALVCAQLVLVRPAIAGGCEKDADCKGDRICRNAVCVAPSAQQTCNIDKDCPGELVCEASVCTAPNAAGSAHVQVPTGAPALGEALPAKAAFVEASFAGAPGSALEISVDDQGGPKGCIAPCSLQLSPGEHVVLVRGARTFSTKLEVPVGGGAFDVKTASPPQNRPLKVVLLVGGLGLFGAGVYGATHDNLLLGLTGFILGTSTATVSALMLVAGTTGEDAVKLRTTAAAARRATKPMFAVTPTRDGVTAGIGFSF
jgi:hypothetical protein